MFVLHRFLHVWEEKEPFNKTVDKYLSWFSFFSSLDEALSFPVTHSQCVLAFDVEFLLLKIH